MLRYTFLVDFFCSLDVRVELEEEFAMDVVVRCFIARARRAAVAG